MKPTHKYRCLLCGENVWIPGTLLDFDLHYKTTHVTKENDAANS